MKEGCAVGRVGGAEVHEQLHTVFVHRPASWMAVFNAMPTICFGFQVPATRSLLSP